MPLPTKPKGLLRPVLLSILVFLSTSTTDPGDVAVLRAFEKGLTNPSLLKWPPNDSDPCGSSWPYVFCSNSRVTQLQAKNLGLEGPLPANFNQLKYLANLGLQNNRLSGPLPSFSGLSLLQYAYLGNNQFDSIPVDFFDGLSALQVLSIELNPLLNQSSGWTLPTSLQNSAQLTNLSLSNCNLVGIIPDFLGSMPSLSLLRMSYNRLSGPIPASFNGSNLRFVTLNNQVGPGLSGPLDVFATMSSLQQLWVHGNQFSGVIPAAFSKCVSLADLRLNNNNLVGPIPPELGTIPALQVLLLDNNKLTGPIPDFKFANYSYTYNSFCQSVPGVPCAQDVSALLDFLKAVNFPSSLSANWAGNKPCSSQWLGVSCNSDGTVSVLNLPNRNLNGSISPSLGKLTSLVNIILDRNNLVGVIPPELTGLKSLRLLNVSSNNLGPPVPTFSKDVVVVIDGNPLLDPNAPPRSSPPSSAGSPPSSTGGSPSSPGNTTPGTETPGGNQSRKTVAIVAPLAAVAAFLVAFVPIVIFFVRKKMKKNQEAASFVVHPRDPSDPGNVIKVSVATNSDASRSAMSLQSETQVVDSGNLLISVQVLRSVTGNFSPENEIGRGGFGVVYKGALDDGTMIAVKRMEAAVISNKALDEFQSEIAVLSKVRHRHLVSLIGYCIEGNEKLLVYEYMEGGALSQHLFQWQKLHLQPLSWKRRLIIALDVARGLEYLHNMAHQSFIHRDLKPSNILLGDDLRAKISDFGLVKLAPDGKTSVATRLAGTFGYLAPEYAVTGKVTTKVDVFSFGVVLMELLTGLTALDEDRPEETRYLASYFWKIKINREALLAALDPALDVTEDAVDSIQIVAELAKHCTSREPQQRPDMSHAVNVLSPLVEKWKPTNEEDDEYDGIAFDKPLLQMVKVWQASDEAAVNNATPSDDSRSSIPARPTGFAESFTSMDAR
ncbi:receptor protein kinase TMK1-like [Nymphaea colorata]|nr:receptor protein kinase TMK1-like [Nymphaea colorata]